MAFARRHSLGAALLAGAAGLFSAGAAHAQDQLGHKLLGTLGLDAGVQAAPGLYVVDQVFWYATDKIADQNGQPLPSLSSFHWATKPRQVIAPRDNSSSAQHSRLIAPCGADPPSHAVRWWRMRMTRASAPHATASNKRR